MKLKYFFIAITIVGCIVFSNFFGYPPASASNQIKPKTHLKEAFDPLLSKRITTMDELVLYIDRNFKGKRNTVDFLNYISSVISSRFYHGYTYYTMSDNWIAALCGQLLWKDLSAIVTADDILKYPKGACSQQSIVLIECVKRFGMDYRKIAFDHHFAAEIKVDGKWYFVDVNQEVKTGNKSLEELVGNGTLHSLYKGKRSDEEINVLLGHPKSGETNEKIASHAQLFHQVTGWASRYFFPTLLCLQFCLLYWYSQKLNKLKPEMKS
jgi:hypothetical protein